MSDLWQALTEVLRLIGSSSYRKLLLDVFRASTVRSSDRARLAFSLVLVSLSALGVVAGLLFARGFALTAGELSFALGLVTLSSTLLGIVAQLSKRGSGDKTSSPMSSATGSTRLPTTDRRACPANK